MAHSALGTLDFSFSVSNQRLAESAHLLGKARKRVEFVDRLVGNGGLSTRFSTRFVDVYVRPRRFHADSGRRALPQRLSVRWRRRQGRPPPGPSRSSGSTTRAGTAPSICIVPAGLTLRNDSSASSRAMLYLTGASRAAVSCPIPGSPRPEQHQAEHRSANVGAQNDDVPVVRLDALPCPNRRPPNSTNATREGHAPGSVRGNAARLSYSNIIPTDRSRVVSQSGRAAMRAEPADLHGMVPADKALGRRAALDRAFDAGVVELGCRAAGGA